MVARKDTWVNILRHIPSSSMFSLLEKYVYFAVKVVDVFSIAFTSVCFLSDHNLIAYCVVPKDVLLSLHFI